MSTVNTNDNPTYTVVECITAELAKAEGLTRAVCHAQIPTGTLADLPIMIVFNQTLTMDANGKGTDRTTFGGAIRQTNIIVQADVYLCLRAAAGIELARQDKMHDAIHAVCTLQNRKPYFGCTMIKAFSIDAKRAVLPYGNENTEYAAVQYTFSVRLF